jgi:hypothetical protein
MESTFNIGTYIGKSAVIPFPGRTGDSLAARYVDVHREPDGSVVLFSRTNPNPGDGSGEQDEQTSAVVIPASLAPALIEALGF